MGLARWMLDLHDDFEVERHWSHVEGKQIYFWKAGNGPELILLHGLLGTAAAWEPIAPMLAAESTVYAVDALCMGESERVPGIEAGLQAQADRVAAFMEAEGIPAADILGTSHGGAVALVLAARHPERVRSLILHAPVNPFCSVADSLIHFYRSRLGHWFAHRLPQLPESFKAGALSRMYGDPARVRPGSLERYTESLGKPGTIDYLLTLLGGWFEDMRSLESALSQVREIPSVLLWGDRDGAVSLESGRRLQGFFRHAELVVLPGAGHLPYEECPVIFAQAVHGFLRQERARREPGPKLVPQQPAVSPVEQAENRAGSAPNS